MSSDDQVITHKRVYTNGIYLHVAEKGHGPPVLLIHGFPETWLSWTNQIHHLAQHGYRVIVPDLRGYGDSDSPPDPASYTVLHIVGDLIGLLDELGVDTEPGRAEKSFSQYDCLTVLKKLLLINAPDLLIAPPGVEIIDFLETPTSLPSWVPEEELQIIASTFEKNGFTAPLNYYRAMDMNWELLGPWQGAKINVPTKLIIGDKDMGVQSLGTLDYVKGEEFRSIVPNLDVVIIDGHHYIQLENAQLVNDEIVSFLQNQAPV